MRAGARSAVSGSATTGRSRGDDRAAVITGGAAGIGRSEVTALAAAGYSIALTALSHSTAAERVAATLRRRRVHAQVFVADLTRPSEVRALAPKVLKEFGRVDVLVNNAGGGAPWAGDRITETDDVSWQSLIDVNLASTFYMIRQFAPAIESSGGGLIINTASIYALTGGDVGWASYAAAKAGVIGLTRGAARDLGGRGVSVMCIIPGIVLTNQTRASLGPQRLGRASKQTPVGRLITPSEIGSVVAHLAQAPRGPLNGSVLDLSGGRNDYWLS